MKKAGRPRKDAETLREDMRRLTFRLSAEMAKLLSHASAELGKSRQDIIEAALRAELLGEEGLSKSEQARIRYHAKGVR